MSLAIALSTIQVTERFSSVSNQFLESTLGVVRGLPLSSPSREELRLDSYLKYPHAAKALYIYKHRSLLRDSNPVPTAQQSASLTTIPDGRLSHCECYELLYTAGFQSHYARKHSPPLPRVRGLDHKITYLSGRGRLVVRTRGKRCRLTGSNPDATEDQPRNATRFLATDHVILNHGQVTWTTPELAPPLLTTTSHQREDVSALDRFNVHRCPTRRVFSGTGLEPMTKQATVRYLYHSATAATSPMGTVGEETRNSEIQTSDKDYTSWVPHLITFYTTPT
ncbi:uncharacterized protein TNCV_337451 [Trichonephila clavipes]|nr:uncharacterized protein TNCV_337451 [Trichonephila clavipes]